MTLTTAGGNETCWTLISGAAHGDRDARAEFARVYLPVVRAYFGARWRGSPWIDAVDDAVQDVFLDCFREGGALGRVEAGRGGGFRAFLYGVARTVAIRTEVKAARLAERQGSRGVHSQQAAGSEDGLSRDFDRAWAQSIMRAAARRQEEDAARSGEDARRRVELLRLRFHEGLPIRDIAALWGADPSVLHHDFARAREEFRDALRGVVAFHRPGTPAEIERECAELVALLG